jgi:hypothetical protein
MDEPDADELAWMACEQLPPEEEYEEFYEEDGDDESGLQGGHPFSGTSAPSRIAIIYFS